MSAETAPPSPPPEQPAPEVPYEEIVKGFEIDRDRYVMVSPEELRALEPERSQTIEIEGFVDLAEVDPVHFEKSYYLAPQRGVGAEKPYALLHQALLRSNRAGVARFVMRTREYLAAIRSTPEIVVLETLFFADEIRSAAEIGNVPAALVVEEREIGMALQFVDLLGMAWEPDRYRDSYRERVLELLRSRAEQEGVATPEPAPFESGLTAVPDLMAALRASVEAAKDRRAGPKSEPRKPRRRTG
jgi:DNA end-binding protein Ku